MLTFELTGSNDNIIFAILSFHRFFELLLKDILKRINPFLAVRIPERPEQLFHFLNDNLPSEEIKSIEFTESLKRFRHAFKHFDKTSPNYFDVLSHYEFLNDSENIEMLDVLSEWRNRIMHNGSTFPNLLAFEFLISQGILPIVWQVIEAESKFTRGYVPPYLKTPTKIDILGEILKTKFSFNDIEKRKEGIGLQLIKIGHLKELGRCLFVYEESRFYREYSQEGFSEQVKRMALGELQNGRHVQTVQQCICCGEISLIIYGKTNQPPWASLPQTKYWCNCLSCNYSISSDTGDPFRFNLISEKLFPSELK